MLIRMFLLSFMLFAGSASAYQWIPLGAQNGNSCSVACADNSLRAVSTGVYTVDNQKFNFCVANQNNEGYRGGYNLSASGCVVGYGGREITGQNAYCLCENNSEVSWLNSSNSDGASCTNTCRRNKLTAVLSGGYSGGGVFNACAANTGGSGFRGGYNLEQAGFYGCTTGYGGKEVPTASNFRCACY